jgi:hypothetical protein
VPDLSLCLGVLKHRASVRVHIHTICLIFVAFMLKLKLFLIVLPTFVRTPAHVRPYATNDPPSIRLVIKIGYKLFVKCKDSVIFSSTNHCVPRASYYVLFQYLGVPKYSHVPFHMIQNFPLNCFIVIIEYYLAYVI